VTRKEAAKMVSLFAAQEFKIQPDAKKVCKFSDIQNEPEELQAYMTLSCQL
jgi:hypothetical protein